MQVPVRREGRSGPAGRRRLACSRVCTVVSMSCPDMSDCHVSVMSVWGVILSLLGKCWIVSCSALQACGWACVLSDPLA